MTGGAESKPAAAGGPPGPSCQTATPLPSPSTARKGTVAVGLRTWVVAEAPLGRGITRTCPFGEAQPTMASCAGPTATLARSDWEVDSVKKAPQLDVSPVK